MSHEPLRGRLLVADPTLPDSNFDRAVVLMLEHGPLGALGLVLNRPGDSSIGELLPEWADCGAPPGVVFVGGPVSPQSAIGLATVEGDLPEEVWTPLFGRFGVVDLARGPQALDGVVARVRVFAGYAGWSAGQLEAEIDAGGWFVVDLGADDALTSRPSQLWRTVLARQPGRLGWVANFPDDPRAN